MTSPLLRCRDLHCRRPLWRDGASAVRGVGASFAAGRFHVIHGPEGSGHNLLLHVLGLLEQPDRGEVWFGDTEATALGQDERDALRQRAFGHLFPASALLPSLTVLENIAFPVIKSGTCGEEGQAERTLFALQFCGLEDAADAVAGDLASDRTAVVAFARAIIHQPRVILAESPAAEEILVPLARRAVDTLGITVLWGTRIDGPAVAAADHVLSMQDGRCAVPAA